MALTFCSWGSLWWGAVDPRGNQGLRRLSCPTGSSAGLKGPVQVLFDGGRDALQPPRWGRAGEQGTERLPRDR